MKTIDKKTQADILASYLLRKSIDNSEIYRLYDVTVGDVNIEEKLITFAFHHPKLIPSLDAALVFLRPDSELRRRIYIMFAILESMPQSSKDFLPQKFNFLDYLGVVGAGIRAIVRVVIGVLVLKLGRL